MNKILRYSFVALLAMIGMNVSAQEFTFDFTDEANPWNFPTEQLKETGTFTKDGKTIIITTTNYTRWFSDTKVLLFGKKDATITLPAFDFDVERIDIVGASGASGKVTFNIFVGDEAVSTEVTGAKSTASFNIAEGKQAAGTVYVIKNTNDNNNQIAKILIYKKGTTDNPGSGDDPETYTLVGNGTLENPFTTKDAIYLANKGEHASDKVYITGKIFKINTTDENITKYGNIDYFISEDGQEADPSFEIYRGKYFNDEAFTVDNKVKVGDEVVVLGSLTMYKTQAETAQGAVLVKLNGSSTGINVVKAEQQNGVIYNVAGQMVTSSYKGLVIKNGKKFVNK